MAKANGKKTKTEKTPQGITHITVGGYKSIAREQSIEIRPLTILAGANSSGKSSIMQPLLLLKQTLEAPYDPGALLLNGPNVKFTSVDQMMARTSRNSHSAQFVVGLAEEEYGSLRLEFGRNKQRQLEIVYQKVTNGDTVCELGSDFSTDDIHARAAIPENLEQAVRQYKCGVVRDRCVLYLTLEFDSETGESYPIITPGAPFAAAIQRIVHLPGLRGNPARAYPVTAVGKSFPGAFEAYVASVIASWTSEGLVEKLGHLDNILNNLGLTWKVEAKQIDDTQVELRVARLPKSSRGGAQDLVNIADVGFGVSQTLPVVVALLAAEPGQLVYLEQPEIHLHPRAQVAMAQILINAAMRGVKVVAETHSSLLLLGVQSLVAEGKLPRDKVILHWFERNDEGATDIRTAELDESGRFGDWPEDFDDVTLEAQRRYLDAAEARRATR